MANTIRDSEGRELRQRAAQRPYWDPFGLLSGLEGWWDPFGVLRPPAPAETFVPAFDARDTKDAYILEADLPGIQESELKMSVTGTRLSVSGKRESEQQEENGEYFCSERAHGTFVRTFTLPDDAELDRVNVELQNGVLRVEIPKREAQPRRIAPTGARDGNGGQRQLAEGGRQRAGAGRPRSDDDQRLEPTPSRQRKGLPSTHPRRRVGAAPASPRRHPKHAHSRSRKPRRSSSR